MKNNPEQLKELIQKSIDNAENLISKITPEILALEGMSGNKGRHFLNNIIYDGCNYLEIGCWKGSTTCAALYNNKPNSSISIDNFSQFSGPKEEFWSNIKKFGNNTHRHIDADSFLIDVDAENIKDIDIYFYDGGHSLEDHYKALSYYINAMSNIFVLIVDDWNGYESKTSTKKAIEDLNLKVHLYKSIPDEETLNKGYSNSEWWNGFGVYILEKQ